MEGGREGGQRKEEVSVSQSPYDAMISPSLPPSVSQMQLRDGQGKGENCGKQRNSRAEGRSSGRGETKSEDKCRTSIPNPSLSLSLSVSAPLLYNLASEE